MSVSACLPFISLPSQLLLAFAAPSREWPYGNNGLCRRIRTTTTVSPLNQSLVDAKKRQRVVGHLGDGRPHYVVWRTRERTRTATQHKVLIWATAIWPPLAPELSVAESPCQPKWCLNRHWQYGHCRHPEDTQVAPVKIHHNIIKQHFHV